MPDEKLTEPDYEFKNDAEFANLLKPNQMAISLVCK
jgi:hypothetical protein